MCMWFSVQPAVNASHFVLPWKSRPDRPTTLLEAPLGNYLAAVLCAEYDMDVVPRECVWDILPPLRGCMVAHSGLVPTASAVG